MRATDKQILNLPVQTLPPSDQLLGYVVGFEIDIDTHSIVKYYVAKHTLVAEVIRNLVGTEVLEITPSQVIAITAEKMTVHDTAIPAIEPTAPSLLHPTPVKTPA